VTRRLLAIAAAIGGLLAAFKPVIPTLSEAERGGTWGPGGTRLMLRAPTRPGPSLDARDDMVKHLAAEVIREEDHVTAIELATWIKDRKPGLRILDLRSEDEFDEYHVPRAERVALDAVVSMRFAPTDTIVLVSDGGAHAAQGWVFLRARGLAHVYFLRGGLGEWIDEIMNPAGASAEVAALSRYFGGVPRKGTATKSSVAAIRRRGC
jgi:rhodanese-related sulfurtransferase